MEPTAAAAWLNTAFGGLDHAILEAMHGLALWAGGVLTPLFSLISLIGEQGILMFLMAFVLMLFKRTRKIGVCVFLAVCIGALCTNIILKDLVARPRPFEESALFHTWWQFVGSPGESGYSFPSGHVTAAMAGITALIVSLRKPAAFLGLLYVIAMALSRVYLVVHYPTDVIAAMLIGLGAAFLSAFIVEKTLDIARERRVGWLTGLFDEPSSTGAAHRRSAAAPKRRRVRR